MRSVRIFMILWLALAFATGTAAAHENRQKEQIEGSESAAASTPGAMQERMEEHMEAMEEAQPKTFPQRLTSWLGRTHPFAVHFPIALFPVAWLALVLARRRGETVVLIRSLIVVAGAAAALAAVLGWLTGGLPRSDPDALHVWHRWVGTALGVVGTLLALCAWRRPDSVESRGMTIALGLVTAALVAQGWLGAALVHGIEHMRF